MNDTENKEQYIVFTNGYDEGVNEGVKLNVEGVNLNIEGARAFCESWKNKRTYIYKFVE